MILVTGGAGYIGSHFAINLLESGKDVIIFDSLENGHIETIETLKQYGNLKFIQGNLKKLDEIREVFISNKIDSVAHFAGYTQIEESVKNPQKYYYNNVYGTLNLLNAMLEFDVKKIIFSSTCAIYGNPKYIPIDETHPKEPINPYGNTKLITETILDDYDKAYGLRSVRLRYFNVVGADSNIRIGEWHETETHLIPNILKANHNQIFEIYGNDYNTSDGTCIRDYINVEDLVLAHIKALEYLEKGGKTNYFNVGTEKGTGIKEILNICEQVKKEKIPNKICNRREGDPDILIANSTKIKNILNWEPKKTIEHSINTAYKWEKSLKSIT